MDIAQLLYALASAPNVLVVETSLPDSIGGTSCHNDPELVSSFTPFVVLTRIRRATPSFSAWITTDGFPFSGSLSKR